MATGHKASVPRQSTERVHVHLQNGSIVDQWLCALPGYCHTGTGRGMSVPAYHPPGNFGARLV